MQNSIKTTVFSTSMGSTIQGLRRGYKLKSKELVYEIVDILGAGSYGITYLATAKVPVGNILMKMKFAIKEHFISASCMRASDGATVIAVPAAKEEVAKSRADFIVEANRLKKLCLKSRNIVSVNETIEANGTAYYVMEYLDGGNPSKCSKDEAVSIITQIAEALDVIHNERVLHLDIKPDNIVMKTNDRNETFPVLIDFGISKHFDSKGRPTTSLNAKGASPGYAPQEQYAGVNEFSPKYDIYALGAVLFYLCTGQNPQDAFKISPNQKEIKNVLTEKNVSPNLERTILKAMKQSAAERTPTVKDFIDDLSGIEIIPLMNVSESNLSFNADKNKYIVTVNSNVDWTAKCSENWCSISKSGNQIYVSVSKNSKKIGRNCQINISGAPYYISRTIYVTQEGKGTIPIHIDDGQTIPPIKKWWERNRTKVWFAIGALAFIGIVTGVCLLFLSNSEKEYQRLTEAIEEKDGATLAAFADKDSVRAFLPLAQTLFSDGDYENALHYASKALTTADSINAKKLIESLYQAIFSNGTEQVITPEETGEAQLQDSLAMPAPPAQPEKINETNDEKFARATNDFKLMQSLAKDNYAKAYYPLAHMYFNRNDLTNAKNWAQKAVNVNVNRQQAQQLLTRIEAAKPATETVVKQPTTIDDYLLLANKGDKTAYAPLAELYLKKYDYDKAHSWAVKAGNARVGLDKARSVVNILAAYGYYDNGEHGGKPSF